MLSVPFDLVCKKEDTSRITFSNSKFSFVSKTATKSNPYVGDFIRYRIGYYDNGKPRHIDHELKSSHLQYEVKKFIEEKLINYPEAFYDSPVLYRNNWEYKTRANSYIGKKNEIEEICKQLYGDPIKCKRSRN
jgi:hypothetical protein